MFLGIGVPEYDLARGALVVRCLAHPPGVNEHASHNIGHIVQRARAVVDGINTAATTGHTSLKTTQLADEAVIIQQADGAAVQGG